MGNIRKLFLAGLLGCLLMKAEAENIDSCLMTLPLQQRYKGEALKKFIDNIEGVEAVSFTDLLKNWITLEVTEGEQKQLTEKVEANIVQTFFLACLQDKLPQQPDFSEVYVMVEDSGMPVNTLTKHNLKFMGLLQKKDVKGAIAEIQHIAEVNLLGDTMEDWLVVGKVLAFVLEKADLAQSKVMLGTLDKILGKESRQDLFTIKRIRDDFEGKIMLIEMGEE